MGFETQDLNETPFNWEEFLYKYRKSLIFLLLGLILLGIGAFFIRSNTNSDKIEIIESAENKQEDFVVAEISGEVEKPGVYKMEEGARVDDLIISAGGISQNADRDWIGKYLNRAAKLSDGQKIYIPKVDQQLGDESAKNIQGYQTISSGFSSQEGSLININTAGQKELESLWGIGPVYAQNIIEQRPYSNIDELLTKGIVKKNTYEKIKGQITVY